MRLEELISVTNGQLSGDSVEFSEVSIDTRTMNPGALYIAIIGERLDGHEYCAEAVQKGAVALVVEKQLNIDIPQLIVENTTHALGEIAKHHREQFQPLTLAVTGSCGKTTVKQMVASIMATQGKVLAPKGSFNNQIGLPLTLLKLDESYDYAVIELGANHQHEIRANGRIAQPVIAAITVVAPAHIEGFGSVAGVAEAKSEIYESLPKEGVAIAEVDSPYLAGWKKQFPHLHWRTFGFTDNANVYATDCELNASGEYQFELHADGKNETVKLPLMGKHNVKNATAAACMALAASVPLHKIAEGLANMKNEGRRLIPNVLPNGGMVIDDSYNANPSSTKAAIDAIVSMPRKKILVLGDMAELGDEAAEYHKDVGHYAKQAGIDLLYAVGEFSEALINGFGASGGIQAKNKTELVEKLKHEMSGNVVCLVKGSRSAGMEEIVSKLTQEK